MDGTFVNTGRTIGAEELTEAVTKVKGDERRKQGLSTIGFVSSFVSDNLNCLVCTLV